MINNLFLMENLVFRTKSNFLKRLYGSRLLNSTLERPRLYHSVCILNVCTDLSSTAVILPHSLHIIGLLKRKKYFI